MYFNIVKNVFEYVLYFNSLIFYLNTDMSMDSWSAITYNILAIL